MEQKSRITLFVLLFSIGLILGLVFLNILQPKLALLLAAGIVIGLIIALESEQKNIWQHAIVAVVFATGAALIARGSLVLSETTIAMLFFVIGLALPSLLTYVRSMFIKTSEPTTQ